MIMSEPMRLRILSLIGSNGKLRGKDLLEKLDLTQPTLSHHMNTLIEADLISARKDGRCVWYSINKNVIESISKAILSLTEEGVAITKVTVAATKAAVNNKPKAKPVAKTASKAATKPVKAAKPATPVVIEEPKPKKVKDKDKDKGKDKDKKKKKKDKSKKKK